MRRSLTLRSTCLVVLLVIATLLTPVSVIAASAKSQLLDEEAFVHTLAPLAADPAIQQEVTALVADAIERQVNFGKITDAVFDSIVDLGISAVGARALDQLRAPAATGLNQLVHGGIETFVQSQTFVGAWESALRLTHRSVVAVATSHGQAGGALTVSDSGLVEVHLAPVVAAAKRALIDRGFTALQGLPSTEATLVVARSSAIPMMAAVYRTAEIAGFWLPIITVLCLAGSVALSVRRAAAVAWVGLGIVIGSASLIAVLAIAGAQLRGALPGSHSAAAPAVDALFGQTTAGMLGTSILLAVLGGILVVLGIALVWMFPVPIRRGAVVEDQ